ncbi:MAG: class I SAM-dependent methyltransferase [Candidatus Thorarchaeota archaeon]
MDNLAKGDWTNPERVKHFTKTYDTRYGDMFWNTFNKLIENKTYDVIADFGCGPGLWLLDAATKFHATRLHGLDESAEMLRQAEEIISKTIPSKNIQLDLINLDTERIAIKQDTLDLAFSGYVMHELADPKDFSSQVYSCLKSNSMCVVFDFVATSENLFVKVMSQVGMSEAHAKTRYPHMCKHSISDIDAILKSAGFETLSSELIDVRAIVVGLKP